MFPNGHFRLTVAVAIWVSMTGLAFGEEPKTVVPTTIELKVAPCGDGWKRWDSIGRIAEMFRERITALVANDGDV